MEIKLIKVAENLLEELDSDEIAELVKILTYYNEH
jgi:hypothetical protein